MNQRQLDWLIKGEKIPISALINPWAVDVSDDGALQFPDLDVSWHPRTGIFTGGPMLGYLSGHAPALGPLDIHPSPLDWLRANRLGVVVIDWTSIFELLRDVPEIRVPAVLMRRYRDNMRPRHMPRVIQA